MHEMPDKISRDLEFRLEDQLVTMLDSREELRLNCIREDKQDHNWEQMTVGSTEAYLDHKLIKWAWSIR